MIFNAQFQFIADALNGSGGFRDGSYLIQYPREVNGKYDARKKIAWYRNHLRAACENFVGYLSKKRPIRDVSNSLIQTIIDDANMRGDSLDIFWSQFMIDAKARGSMLLLVDMPQDLNVRQAPFLFSILPEKISKYTLDKHGKFTFIEISGEVLNADSTRISATYGWDELNWWVRDGEITLDSGAHNLGVCPVLAFVEAGEFPHLGNFAQIADISRRYYNACSELDELLRTQTFSLLTYHMAPPPAMQFTPQQIAETIGTQNIIAYGGDAPSFIAPPEGPAMIYGEILNKLEALIRQIALTVEQPSTAESGVALTLRFQQLNSALAMFAQSMCDFERRMWDVVNAYLRLSDDSIFVQWSNDYSLADIETELAELQQMQVSGFPPSAIKSKKKQIVGLALPNIAANETTTILAEIDAEI